MLDLKQAHRAVSRSFFLFWEGWDIVSVDPKVDGFNKQDGIWYNGKWSTKTVISPNREGLYDLPVKYTKHLVSARG